MFADSYFVCAMAQFSTSSISPRTYMDALARLDDDLHSFDRHLNGTVVVVASPVLVD